MHSSSDDHFHRKRKARRGATSDRGTESGHNDIALDIVPRYLNTEQSGSPESYLCPWSLWMP
eukprot:1763060-Pyramimonas_sp.AAC.1